MRKTCLTALLATALLGVGVQAASAEWMAVAANYQGHGYGEGYSEESAREEAINDCEVKTGYDCSWQTTSVPTVWYLSVVYCNGEPSTSGSRHGWQMSGTRAAEKLGYFDRDARQCSVAVQY